MGCWVETANMCLLLSWILLIFCYGIDLTTSLLFRSSLNSDEFDSSVELPLLHVLQIDDHVKIGRTSCLEKVEQEELA